MSTWYKQSVCGELTEETADGLRKVERLYHKENNSLYVTALRNGDHMPGSFHHMGRAFDIRKGGITKAQLKKVLGLKWDVVSHSTHYHCELDRK